jgi:hypothetical protein
MNLIHSLQDYNNPDSLVSRFRRARTQRIVGLISQAFQRSGGCRILDMGGRPDYWTIFDRPFLEQCKVKITCINPEHCPSDDPMFDVQVGDACQLPQYADNSFDLTHSNSVIEHVGDWTRMLAFASEARRLAPTYYVQCPYFWFPIEPHFSAPFFHWMPEQWRAGQMLKKTHGFCERASDMGQAMATVQHARLLDKRQMQFLFPDAAHPNEVILGITKSLIAVRSAA